MHMLYRWHSIDTSSNRFRFYALSVGSDLWGDVFLLKQWGRIGTRGQRQFIWASAEELSKLLVQIQREREMHGYQVVDSFYVG